MGKELVISANRHETKVAILEDDQLVEIYFQRANEYSLAGSIHKGRVTRVLPGMQSAFVDLGLERDTFLYVSDFFEENEEYEALSGDEKVRRPPERERGERPPRPEPQAAVAEPIPAVAAAAPAPAVERTPSVPAATPQEARPEEGERGGDRGGDRRGRRSRRRRGRGRGFPDSKYASDSGDATEESPAAARAEAEAPLESAPQPSRELFVLPGESLAKYRHATGAGGDSESEVSEEVEETEEVEEAEVESAAEAEDAVESEAAAPVEDSFEAEPMSASEPVASGWEEVSPAGDLPEEDDVVALEEAVLDRIEAAEEQAMTAGSASAALDLLDLEPPLSAQAKEELEEAAGGEPEGYGESEGESAEAVRLDPMGDLMEARLLEAEEGESAAIDEGEPGEEEPSAETEGTESLTEETEAPEPARIPQSLTATLREQGGRYPHRSSRRMRRRRGGYENRGDGRNEGRPEGRPENRSDAPPTSRPVEAAPLSAAPVREERSAPRPEKTIPQVSITDLLKEGQEILVQIAKEPLGQKGARITSHIALPGRYVVYMPTVEHLGVSRKIGTDEERLRLKRILQTHRVGIPGGFIMRTAGEGKSEEEIAADMTYLFNLWLDIRQKAEKRNAPALIHHDLDIVQRILRDQFAENFKAIWVDNEEVYESILHFVQRFQPTLVGRIKMYTRPSPIFDAFNITQELEKALRPKVWLKSGGYIVINQTEALVAIDVNTGKYVGKSNRLEDTIVKTNTEAVKEIVRQIRLRDLGGIIVVDFIDMDERKNRQKVMQTLEETMRADKAPNKILQFNDFGLVAITRKRVKQSLERTLCAPCPYCEGAGYVKSVSTVVGEILQEAVKIASAVEGKDCLLRVHPEVAKYLKSTENKYLEELEGILGRPVMVVSDGRLHQEKFDLT